MQVLQKIQTSIHHGDQLSSINVSVILICNILASFVNCVIGNQVYKKVKETMLSDNNLFHSYAVQRGMNGVIHK